MGFRVTPEMRKKAGDKVVDELFKYARSLRCVVVGDNVVCTEKQKKLVVAYWRKITNGKG